MSGFVDASVMTGILRGEEDADTLADMVEAEPVRLTSAIAIWETARSLAKASNGDVAVALGECHRLLRSFGIEIVPIVAAEADAAVDAHRRYGKGVHPAKLNMGDCFAYACAKTNDARLLYKGEDFAHTDMA